MALQLSTLHRAGRLHQQGAMSTSVTGSGATGYVLIHPLSSVIKIMIISIIYVSMSLRSHMHKYEATNLFLVFFWIKLILKLPKFLTIQKPNRHFWVVGFAGMLKPNVFGGTHYKRWHQRCILWLTAMHYYFITKPRSVGPHTPEEECVFQDADTTFKGAIISVLGDSTVDAYVTLQTDKEMWDVLEAKYGVSDAGSELYVME